MTVICGINFNSDMTSSYILELSKNGILKVSPFYNYSDDDLKEYLKIHQLPNETRYYDPTKQISNRECGIHD